MSDDHDEPNGRSEAIAELDADDPFWRERNKPGTFGCHEALHVASVLSECVYSRLAEHPAIIANPEWHALAMEAGDTLFDLYQAIGAVHLEAPAATE